MSCQVAIKSGPRKGSVCGKPITQSGVCGCHKTPYDRRVFKMGKYEQGVKTIGHSVVITDPNAGYWPTQITAGQDVLQVFQSGRHYCILAAQCQSGKTGVSKNAIANIQKVNQNILPIVIIPISSNEILEQTKREFQELVDVSNILSLPQLHDVDCLKRRMEKNPGRDYLIVIDESHLNSLVVPGEASCLFNALKSVDICTDGSFIPANCYILSISATPTAELAGLLQLRGAVEMPAESGKDVVYFKPGENYYGIADMFSTERVFPAVPLKEEGDRQAFAEMIAMRYSTRQKYGIVRLRSHVECLSLANYLARHNIPALIYNSYNAASTDISTVLKRAPDQLIMVLLVQRLRASIQLDTQHVCMVHENITAMVDTTVQGLPGRMCGYGKRAHAVDVFCNVDGLKAQLKWINSGFAPECIPHCRTVVGNYIPAKVANLKSVYPEPIAKSIYYVNFNKIA
jgi:hypothetical protein